MGVDVEGACQSARQQRGLKYLRRPSAASTATMLCCLLLAIVLASLTFAAPSAVRGPWRFQPLRFTRDGTFHISIFEDLHFGENAWDSWGPQQDINSIAVLNQVLDAEDQQLVVLNGDLITGENQQVITSSCKRLKQR